MKSQSHLTMQSQPNAQRLNRSQHQSAAASARPARAHASWLLLLLLLATTVFNLTGCGGGWGEAAPKAGVVVANSPSVGGTLTLHAAPAGTGPFTFQWFKNGVPVTGATAAAYSVVVQASDNGAIYTVAVTSAGGTAISAPFVLNMGIAPAITAQPKDGTVAAGQTATLSVEATGTAPLAYQWFRNGVILNGATGAAYTTPVSSPADTGSVFTVTVANPIGTVTSAPATLTVTTLSAPLAFNLIPGKTYGDSAFPISATSASPGTVTYSVVSGPATLSGSNRHRQRRGHRRARRIADRSGQLRCRHRRHQLHRQPRHARAQLSNPRVADLRRPRLSRPRHLSLSWPRHLQHLRWSRHPFRLHPSPPPA